MTATRYLDGVGSVVAVTRGLGGVWIVARGSHRVKSPAMPVRQTQAEAQQDLDAYAASHLWEPIKEES